MPGSGSRRAAARTLRDRLTTPRTPLGLLLAVVIGAGACTTPPAETRNPPPEALSIPTSLRVAVTEPSSIDPAHVDSSSALLVASQVFDGLVVHDSAGGTPRPAAAERWRFLEDGRRIEFRLRADVTFHDGTPVRAADFVFAWNRIADPDTHSPYAFLLETVEGYRAFHVERTASSLAGVEAADPLTLVVTLTRPQPGFVTLAAHPALSPVPAAAARVDYDVQPVGNGPYRVTEPWGLGQPVVLERYEDYHGDPAAIDRLQFDVYEEADDAWPDFLNGEVDVAPVPPPLIAEARSRYGDAGIVTLARLLYCGFNMTLDRFRDARIRRAFSVALDRDAIASAVYGELAVPASGLVPPSIAGHDPQACGDRCEHDPARASDLVGEVAEPRRTFTLHLIHTEVGEQLSGILAEQLGEAGLVVEPQLLEEEAYRDVLRGRRQQVFCLVWDADAPTQAAMIDPLLHSGSPDNHTLVSNPRLDAALDAARSRLKPAERREAYAEAERVALEVLPVVPVVWFRSHLAAQPYVEGLRLDAMGLFEAAELRLLTEPRTPGEEPPAVGPTPTPTP